MGNPNSVSMRFAAVIFSITVLAGSAPCRAQGIDQAVHEFGYRVAGGSIDDEAARKFFGELIEIARKDSEKFRAPERAKLEEWLGQESLKIRLEALCSRGGNIKESVPLEIEIQGKDVIIRVGTGEKQVEVKVAAEDPEEKNRERLEAIEALKKLVLSTSEDRYPSEWLLKTDPHALLKKFKGQGVPIEGYAFHLAVIRLEGKGIDWEWTVYDDRVDRVMELAERMDKSSRKD
ncbi:MAG: hypothetical protein MUF31_06665 [Akkermansiaceae bacterium]|nr:hypothetical protein [Akkermansiaceae bacterium]